MISVSGIEKKFSSNCRTKLHITNRSTAFENRESSTMSEFKQVKINKCSPDTQPQLGKEPVRMICPKCSQEMTTKVEHKPSIYAWMTGIALACFG